MNDLITHLINYAFDHGIGVVMTHRLPAHFPSSASAGERKILVNLNWREPTEIPFIIAHEIGHLVNGDNGVRYYSSATIRSKSEAAANSFAIGLLMECCQAQGLVVDNPVTFCERFGVPASLDYLVYLKMMHI